MGGWSGDVPNGEEVTGFEADCDVYNESARVGRVDTADRSVNRASEVE